tara:strand:- start:21307 stop:21495 length:189 start_codon:yes stop_codon:yes gene_type:complete
MEGLEEAMPVEFYIGAVVAIKERHGKLIQFVDSNDLMDELIIQNVRALQDAIRWSDQVFGRS